MQIFLSNHRESNFMQITECAPEDIRAIFDLYDQAVDFQKTESQKHWQKFDESLIEKEISENRLLKISNVRNDKMQD